MELDRGYVINGSDLRIVLGRAEGAEPLVRNPRDAAEHILKAVGVPLDTHRGLITQKRLAGLLECFSLTVRAGNGKVHGEVDDPETVAKTIFAGHAARLAHEDKRRRGPWADGAVVDAHICCEHAPVSLAASELAVMDKVTALLHPYPQRTVKRALEWATDYLTDFDNPPF